MEFQSEQFSSRFVEEYRSLVSWHYRMPAIPVHAPALVRHLGYWIADASHEKRHTLFHELTDSIADHNNGFRIENVSAFKVSTEQYRRYPTNRIRTRGWRQLPLKLVVALHHEYVTLSAVLELDESPDSEETAPIFDSINLVKEVLANRYNGLALDRSLRRPDTRCEEVRSLLAGPYKQIFMQVWADFDDLVLRGPADRIFKRYFPETQQFTNGTSQDLQAKLAETVPGSRDLGKIFADFRGFVMPCSELDNAISTSSSSGPATHGPADLINSEKSILYARSILPFMTAEPENAMPGKMEKELTVSLLLEQRCIYASTLGAQPPQSANQPEQPLTYFLMEKNINSWQMGRLIDRLHMLGAVRLAGRRHLRQLRDAGDALHTLEKKDIVQIEMSRPGMRVEAASEPRTAKDLEKEIHDRERAIESIKDKLFSAFNELLRIRQSIPGGLPYRVERSRYYRTQFRSLVGTLRIGSKGRIEGFQPYDEYVERRFGSAYEFIDMVGKRFSRLDQQLTAMYQEVRTLEVARMQKTITEQTGTIKELQDIGENALFLVILPYYASNLLVYVLPFFNSGLQPEQDLQLHSKIVAGAIVLGAALLAVVRHNRSERKAAARKAEQNSILHLNE